MALLEASLPAASVDKLLRAISGVFVESFSCFDFNTSGLVEYSSLVDSLVPWMNTFQRNNSLLFRGIIHSVCQVLEVAVRNCFYGNSPTEAALCFTDKEQPMGDNQAAESLNLHRNQVKLLTRANQQALAIVQPWKRVVQASVYQGDAIWTVLMCSVSRHLADSIARLYWLTCLSWSSGPRDQGGEGEGEQDVLCVLTCVVLKWVGCMSDDNVINLLNQHVFPRMLCFVSRSCCGSLPPEVLLSNFDAASAVFALVKHEIPVRFYSNAYVASFFAQVLNLLDTAQIFTDLDTADRLTGRMQQWCLGDGLDGMHLTS